MIVVYNSCVAWICGCGQAAVYHHTLLQLGCIVGCAVGLGCQRPIGPYAVGCAGWCTYIACYIASCTVTPPEPLDSNVQTGSIMSELGRQGCCVQESCDTL